MAVEIFVRKLYDKIIPVDALQAEIMEELKPNGEYKAVFTQTRNPGFHRKFFALLRFAYENYEQPEVFYNGIRVFRSKEVFRDEIIISCGYFELGLNKRNKVVQRAKSISFAKMDQETFEALFSKAIDVIMQDYLTYYTEEDMQRLVDEVLRFAG